MIINRMQYNRSSATERDLGVVIDRTGKSSVQCILAARKSKYCSWNDKKK